MCASMSSARPGRTCPIRRTGSSSIEPSRRSSTAFLSAPPQTLANIKPDDNRWPARYARAIAYYRIPQLDKALEPSTASSRTSPAIPISRS